MLLNKHEIRYKEYLATEKRYNEVWTQLRKRPLIKLEKPYQNGWELYIDFRDDIKRRADFPAIKQALSLVAHTTTTRNVKLIKRIRSNRRYDIIIGENNIGKHKYQWGYMPSLALLHSKKYDTLTPDVKKLFDIDSYSERWYTFRGHMYYLNIPKYWLELKVRPNIMTHRYEKGGPLERLYAELKEKISLYWLEFGTDYSSSYPAYKDRAKTRAKIQKFKKGEIEDIVTEKIPREYDF